MKLLNLLSQRPDSTGSGIYLQAIIRESAKQGYQNFLIASIQPKRPAIVNSLDSSHISYVEFPCDMFPYSIPGMSDVMPYESSRFCDLSVEDIQKYEEVFLKVINKVVTAFQPDIIHSHHLWILTSLIRQTFRDIPVLASCHGSDLRQFQSCLKLQPRVLKGCRNLDRVLALSKTQKSEIADLYQIDRNRIAVVGAGFDSSLFQNQKKHETGSIQLVYAGKLSRAKGVPWMLEALFSLLSLDWELHLVGDGSGAEKEECIQMAKKLGTRVKIYGAVSQSELAEIMKKSHILILPSFFEGLPLVVLEGIASGCRVIATDLPGVQEVRGKIPNNYISTVPIPRLYKIDQPVKEDLLEFKSNLSKAIEYQIYLSQAEPNFECSELSEQLARYTWKGVFQEIAKAYEHVRGVYK